MNTELAQFNINGTNCFQRFLCEKLKDLTNQNHMSDSGNKLNSRLNGFIAQIVYSKWAKRFLVGTALDEAIEQAKAGKNCAEAFHLCTIDLPEVTSLNEIY